MFIDNNKGANSWKDMLFMSKCVHNIIANNSFSWCTAWLNSNLEKKDITPKQWYKNANRNINDLIPPVWIQL